MTGRMDHAAELIAIALEVADVMRDRYELWMRHADDETRPRVRAIHVELAAGAMDLANDARAEAEKLLREYEAAGGVFKR
jgi:hypothetical protein